MMNVEHNINWFLQEPTRLMVMKPFTRGGEKIPHGWDSSKIMNDGLLDVGFSQLEKQPISQDLYLTEYSPDLHHIILNKSIPKIKVLYNGMNLGFSEITQTASFQKLIHAAHVSNLTANPIEF